MNERGERLCSWCHFRPPVFGSDECDTCAALPGHERGDDDLIDERMDAPPLATYDATIRIKAVGDEPADTLDSLRAEIAALKASNAELRASADEAQAARLQAVAEAAAMLERLATLEQERDAEKVRGDGYRSTVGHCEMRIGELQEVRDDLSARLATAERVIREIYAGEHGSIPHPSEVWQAGVWLVKRDDNQGHAERLMSEEEFAALRSKGER